MVWSRLAMTLAAGAASMSFMAGAAHAQIGQSDAPLEIVSDKSEYLQNEGRGVYTGNVVATQGESKITTDKLTFVCSNRCCLCYKIYPIFTVIVRPTVYFRNFTYPVTMTRINRSCPLKCCCIPWILIG